MGGAKLGGHLACRPMHLSAHESVRPRKRPPIAARARFLWLPRNERASATWSNSTTFPPPPRAAARTSASRPLHVLRAVLPRFPVVLDAAGFDPALCGCEICI